MWRDMQVGSVQTTRRHDCDQEQDARMDCKKEGQVEHGLRVPKHMERLH